MHRLIAFIFVALVVCLLLPAIARAAQAIVPLLVGVLILLVVGQLLWPGRRRR
jgi:hypothetical protein